MHEACSAGLKKKERRERERKGIPQAKFEYENSAAFRSCGPTLSQLRCMDHCRALGSLEQGLCVPWAFLWRCMGVPRLTEVSVSISRAVACSSLVTHSAWMSPESLMRV